jgi:hypothetical protein
MRNPLIVLAMVGAFAAAGVAPALAAPPSPVPSVPKNCHEWNQLLHIQNVRSCDDPPPAG